MKTRKHLTVGLLSIALLCGMVPANEAIAAKKPALSTKKMTVTKGAGKTLKVRNAKKGVKWKILSGKKYITLMKKGKTAVMVKGRQKGVAKVQAMIGKKKLACTVTVINAKTKASAKPANPTESPKPSEVTNAPQPTISVTAAPKPTDSTTPAATGSPEPTDSTTPKPTGSPGLGVTPRPTSDPTTEKNEQDVTALKALIAEQRERGATVNENINARDEYTWINGKLTGLTWSDKNLSGELNLGACVNLTWLDCSNYTGTSNRLSTLDVSKNVNLTSLACSNTGLNNLDISENTNLTSLVCEGLPINNLDVSNNINLTSLNCGYCSLRSLDVSKNINLTYLNCTYCDDISSLDLSKNVNLKTLICSSATSVIGYNRD